MVMTEQKLEVRRNRGRTGRAESYGPASLPSGLGRFTFWFNRLRRFQACATATQTSKCGVRIENEFIIKDEDV